VTDLGPHSTLCSPEPVDVKALAKTVRRGLDVGSQCYVTMRQAERVGNALAALDALLAEVDRRGRALQLAREAILTSCCDVNVCDRSEPLRQDTHGCAATTDGFCIRLRALNTLAAAGFPTGGDDAA